jgi:16S rRNA pseudouridine516 synthase
MPVGRLDRDTTGLLFFTSDGELNHSLLSPQRHVDKTYRAQVDADLTQEDVERFAQGMDLGDFVTETAELVLEGPRTGLVTIHEGKFHQVKRMFEAVGKQVLLLDRLSFGPLKLPEDLPRGMWRELNREEIQSLYRQVGMEEPV